MPLQFMLVADAYTRIGRAQNRELTGMAVGMIVGAMNQVRPVRDVMFDLVSECGDAMARVERLASG